MESTVVSAAHGVLGPLLGKLADLLGGKFGRVRGVRSDILSLQSELTVMHAALKNYTMLEDPDVQVKAWISLLRELAYDTEDCVDKFIRRLGKKRRHRGFKDFLRRTARALKTLNSRCGIANRIDELKARIKHVKKLKDSYKLSDTTCTTTRHEAVDPRLQALFAEEARLVGVEGPRDDLAKWIIKEEKNTTNCKVLSIVGFAGLGKTTLANEVYRKIQGHFDCHAFISVSQKPVIKKIIIDVISQVSFQDGSTKDTGDWDEIKCIAKLRKLLQDKRYLIIIDDIWSTQAWDTIQCAFPENNCSSRIIATTRIVDVARSCCSGGHDRVFHMEALSDIHSRRLFFTRIFGSEDHCPDTLKEVSVEILNKCGGLPLAIISISGFLANIPSVKDEWKKIKGSIGSALEKERSLEGMRNILLLSYNDLPPNLKTCLLYLSVFPEDYVISRKRLVRRWIAEGFISEEPGLSRQEVAESYFYELINKSMIQPVYIGDDGKARACRVHDIMLEIIISKSSEDNFITVVGGGQTIFSRRHGFIRRLSIQHIDQELASALANEDLSHVRSLTVTTSGCIRHLPGLVKFKALRVLDFAYCEGLEEYIMKGMDKLFQLKYFRLEGRGISTLPSGIVTLGNLETLDLRYTSVLELPAKIDQLTKLEHVLAEGDTKIPNGIGNMRNLQVISGFNITLSPTDVVEDLGNLARLDELNVGLDGGGSGEYTRHEEMLLSSLCKLGTSKLRSLHITRRDGSLEFLNSWSPLPFSLQICHMASFYYFTNVPKWIAPTLTNLVDLLICLTDLKEGLHTLGELPALLCVELWWKTTANDRVTVQGVGFPSLKKFVLRSREGACIAFVKGAMPKLEKLRMPLNVLVARTHDFYLGIEHLPCLKEVSVWIARVGATSSTRKVAADAVRKEVGAHTNHPMVKFVMRSDEHDIEETAHYEEKSKEDNDTAGN